MVEPRHIAEALYLFEIEIGTEETRDADIFCTCSLIRAVISVFNQSIDAAQHSVRPAAAGGRNRT